MSNQLQTYTAQLPTVPDVPPTQVEWIAKVRQSPVLRMDEDQATAAVVAALVQIAPYLTEPPENHVSREFAKVFKEAYPLLNPIECKAAVMMQTTGKLGESDNRIFYGGKFSISTMCAILNAYQEWRQKVVAAIVHAEDEAKREEARRSRDEAWAYILDIDKKDFLNGEYVYRVVKYAQPNKQEPYVVIVKPTTWQDIPPFWFEWANDAGLLTWAKGEKQERVDQARLQAETEVKNENENKRQSGRAGEILQGKQFTDSVDLRARIIQRKRAVWDKLVNK